MDGQKPDSRSEIDESDQTSSGSRHEDPWTLPLRAVTWGQRLGGGLYGVVWQATDERLRRPIAVKFLTDTAEKLDARAVLRNAQTLARLQHPGLVTVLDVATFRHPETQELVPALFMELVPGVPLSRWKGVQHPRQEVVRAAIEFTEAIIAMHSAGLHHGDIHLDNVMVMAGGRTKVIDWRHQDTFEANSTATRTEIVQRDVRKTFELIEALLQRQGFEDVQRAIVGIDELEAARVRLEEQRGVTPPIATPANRNRLPLGLGGLGIAIVVAAVSLFARCSTQPRRAGVQSNSAQAGDARSLGTESEIATAPKRRYAPPISYYTDRGPRAVAIADLNSDSRLDVVVASETSKTVSVFLGQGDGHLFQGVSYGVGEQPAALGLAELDGQPGMDIAVPDARDNSVRILRNKGDGTFPSQLVVPSEPAVFQKMGSKNSVVVSDVNNDGVPDIVLGRIGDGKICLMLGTGNGRYRPATAFDAASENTISAVAAVDIENDGDVDVVLAIDPEGFEVLRNDGAGGFFRSGLIPVQGAHGIGVGDLNGDGFQDLVIATYSSPYLYATTTLNYGGGVFSPGPALSGDGGDHHGAWSAIVSPLGTADAPSVIALSSNANAVVVYEGLEVGRLGSPAIYRVGKMPDAVAVGDLNRDGVLDIVTANLDDNTISVLLSN